MKILKIFTDLGPKDDLILTLIDNTPVAYIVLDDEYRIHFVNESFVKLRKLDKDKTIGEKCYNISNGGKQCRQCAVEKALRTGRKAFISRKDTLVDGTVRFIDDYAIPLFKGEKGKTQYVLEIMVNRTQEMLAREQRDTDYDEILSILITLLDAKDEYTATHSKSVRALSINLAAALGLGAKEVFDIAVAASLHDIGKVRIPDAILNKPGKLTDEEFATIKQHPVTSYEMLSGLTSFEDVKQIVRHHHERIDGRGYPDGLLGDDIVLGAKITAVADTYDAITSSRSYRDASTHAYALTEIERVAGTQLDYDIVQTFLKMDFENNCNIDLVDDGEAPPVERTLYKQSVHTESSARQVENFQTDVDTDVFLSGIFENTPCGYVLMDMERKVRFASRYFLNYMGLEEEDVVGKCCFDVADVGAEPCPGCPVEKAVKTGQVEYIRQEQNTNNGRKVFDLFGIPLTDSNNGEPLVLEVIIDRTEEVRLEREREKDFTALITMLESILDEQENEENYEKMSIEVLVLRKRLNNLLEKHMGNQ